MDLAKMKQKHVIFVQNYLVDGNATQAYLKAYPNVTYETAVVNASRLLTNAKVKEAIDAGKKELKDKMLITKEDLIKDLIDIKNAQKTDNAQAAIKAIEVISKMLGLNEPEKVEHSGTQAITVIKTIEVKKDK